ncbi:hypothetical protein AW736_11735 [Termitidicoccus mucosus]|uniref:Uncharacterized protein n=1 Tax=Termitidicoccus mucosus TaxID=1184151 RepID=A0A178IL98_9BACT|nr:hypothetical protein AW736_11735 [Opitutaceae bacterium TSB47]
MAQLLVYINHMLPANGEMSAVPVLFIPPVNTGIGFYFRHYYNPVMFARSLAQLPRRLYSVGNDNPVEDGARSFA